MNIAKMSRMTYHVSMSLTAVGAYLKTLRESRGLTLADVASSAGTNEAQVIRIEKGGIDTRGSLLLMILKAVRGRPEDLLGLMTSPEATEEDGRRIARLALAPPIELSEDDKKRLLSLNPDQRRLVLDLVSQMRVDLQRS